jgi:hypothetical protein
MSAPALFIHAKNDYSIEPGPALAAEMKRLGKPHELKMYPPFGADTRAGHNFLFRSVATWESDVFAFLGAQLSILPKGGNRIDPTGTERGNQRGKSLLQDRRTSSTMVCRLLERVRQLQDTQVISVTAGDLQADRQPGRGEPGRH